MRPAQLAALCLALVAWPAAAAHAQVAGCLELSQGVGFALGDGAFDARPCASWELAGGLCYLPARGLLVAALLELEYAQLSLDGQPVDRIDAGLGTQVLFKLRPVLVGLHLFTGLRLVDDARVERLRAPDGTPLAQPVQIGVDLGPMLWWPVRRWLAFSLGLDYQYSTRWVPEGLPAGTVVGWPEHGLALRLGLVGLLF